MADNFLNEKKLSVIISMMNAIAISRFCLDCLKRNVDLSKTEIIVIDNASDDGTTEWLNEEGVRLIRNESRTACPLPLIRDWR